MYKSNNFIGSAVCARSAQEAISVLWFINVQLEKLYKTKNLSTFLNKMKRLAFGFSKDEEFPEKLNILDCIDSVDKSADIGFRRNYNILSDYAHPNYSGTIGTYAKTDKNSLKVEIGPKVKSIENLKKIIQVTMDACLYMLTPLLDAYVDLLNKSQDVCIDLHEQGILTDIFYNRT